MRCGISLCAVGCAATPLGDVPIIGGSSDQRRDVADELAAFDSWVGPGKVRLHAVKIDPDTDGGLYVRPSRTIRVDASLDGWWLRTYLRHELAHAFDAQNGRPWRDPHMRHVSDQLAAQPDLVGDPDDEAFANACEIGPFAAALLTSSCTAGGELAALGDWLLREVWTGYSPAASVAIGPVEAEYASNDDLWWFRASEAVVPGQLNLELLGDEFTPVTVNLHTGRPVPAVADADPTFGLPSEDEGGLLVAESGWPGGPALGLVMVKFAPVDLVNLALVTFDGARSTRVDECVGSQWAVFAADDQLWFAAGDGETVRWSPVDP